MIRNTIILLFGTVLSYSFPALAQDSATVSGLVTDGEDGKALFGASVLLSDMSDNVIQGVVADTEGRFQLSDIQPGAYQLKVSYIA